MPRLSPFVAALIVAALLIVPLTAQAAESRAVGDTLTVVMRPILSDPAIVVPGESFSIEALASPSTSGWAASLTGGPGSYPLSIDSASYVSSYERWFLTATVPADVPAELYNLEVTASGGIDDVVAHAVSVRQSISNNYYFVQITDTHLPTHLNYYESGADSDTTEMDDLRAVIDDINIINPDFVLFTGDVVNEGELETYLNKRYFTRAQRLIEELNVPVYIVAGNHDVGGWDDTPPPDGTARRNWWRFFGWRYLYDPPPAENIYTQNYSFDYGGVHFVGIEAYNNYDRWRRSIYGTDSFTSRQLSWLADDLGAVPPATQIVAFYHNDFRDQLNLSSLGIDCALWGHVHYSSGSTSAPPYNLSLEAVCDGGRAMRLVRVLNGYVHPLQPIEAGASGQNLTLSFSPANDGTHEEVTATATNNQPQMFENAVVKFRVPADRAPYEVDNGEILQTIVEGPTAVCYVGVSLAAHSTTDVTISPSSDTGVPDGAVPALALLRPASPNPSTTGTTLAFSTAAPGRVRAEIFDVSGRRVATLVDGVLPAGAHEITWDLTGGSVPVASGVYFYRIESAGESLEGKFVAMR